MTVEQVLGRLFDLNTKTGDGEYLLVCPFHDDHKPSLSLNVKKLVFRCHACGESGGHEKLIAKQTGLPTGVVRYEMLFYEQVNGFPQADVAGWHRNLMQSDAALKFLQDQRRWSLAVIERYKIGLHEGRIQIPIYSAFGDLVNVRSYRPRATEGKMLNSPGHGRARLFPIHVLHDREQRDEDFLLVSEGEPDCLAALSHGLRCVTSTSGAASVPPGVHHLTEGCKVLILYDADDAGNRGADKLSAALHGASVGVANLRPLLGDKGKDLTDYLASGGSVEVLTKHLSETPLYKKAAATATPVVNARLDVSEPPIETTLQESSKETFYHKLVKIQVMVSGKTLAPYLVPRKVEIKCPLPGLRMCDGCGLAATGGAGELLFDHGNPLTLELIETYSDRHSQVFRKILGIPSKCGLFGATVLEAQNIEEAKVIPTLEHTSGEAEYVMRQVYLIGHGLRPNTSYELVGLTLPHPKTQQVTYLVHQAVGLEDSISKFHVNEELVKQLQIFSVGNDQDREETERDPR